MILSKTYDKYLLLFATNERGVSGMLIPNMILSTTNDVNAVKKVIPQISNIRGYSLFPNRGPKA